MNTIPKMCSENEINHIHICQVLPELVCGDIIKNERDVFFDPSLNKRLSKQSWG